MNMKGGQRTTDNRGYMRRSEDSRTDIQETG